MSKTCFKFCRPPDTSHSQQNTRFSGGQTWACMRFVFMNRLGRCHQQRCYATADPDDGGCFHGNGVLRSWSRCLCGSTPAHHPGRWWPLLFLWCLSATLGSHGGPASAARRMSACLAGRQNDTFYTSVFWTGMCVNDFWAPLLNRLFKFCHVSEKGQTESPRWLCWPLQKFITGQLAFLLSGLKSTPMATCRQITAKG